MKLLLWTVSISLRWSRGGSLAGPRGSSDRQMLPSIIRGEEGAEAHPLRVRGLRCPHLDVPPGHAHSASPLPPSLPQLRVPPGDLLPSGRSSRLSLGRPCSQPSMSVECAAGPAARFSTKMASEGVGGEQPPPVQTLAAAVPGSLDAVRHDPSRWELSFGVAGNGGAFSADWIRGSAPERAGMGWCRRRGVPPSFACFRSQSSSRRRNAEREDEELVSGG